MSKGERSGKQSSVGSGAGLLLSGSRLRLADSASGARRACGGGVGGLALVLLCLAVYLPGLWSIPAIDRDESRFAQASRQMFEAVAFDESERNERLHGGGLVVPMVQDRVRLNKPPLIYWLQAASAAVFTLGKPLDDAIWMYRIPGVLCAIASVLLTWRLGLRMFDPRAAWLGAALLAVCPLVVFDAHQARADQLLLTTVLATQFCLWRVWRAEGPGGGLAWAAAMWACIAAGIMAKGPITPMVAGLTAVGLSAASGRWKWMLGVKLVIGLPIIAACAGPWVWGVVQHIGWDRYVEIVTDETVGRSLEAKEGHWGPPGYHTVLLAVLFWPGSMLTAAGVARAVGRGLPRRGTGVLKRRASRDAELFCLAWIVPAWIVFEFVGTKLPHYTMPMYPAVALVSARCVLGLAPERRLWRARMGAGFWVWIGIGAVVAVVAPMAAAYAGLFVISAPALAVGAIVVGLVCAILLARAMLARRPSDAQGWTLAAAAVLAIGIFQFILPQARALWVSERIDGLAREQGVELNSVLLGSIGFHEDSLVFETRGRLIKFDDLGTGDQFLGAGPGAVLLVPRKDAALLRSVERLGSVDGLNYATGKRVELDLVRRAGGATP